MPLTESSSFPVASILALLTFSGMQWAKPLLASSQSMTLLGGFLGSILFVFLLTAIGNLEQVMFGKGFQTKLPETIFAMIVAMTGLNILLKFENYSVVKKSKIFQHSKHRDCAEPSHPSST